MNIDKGELNISYRLLNPNEFHRFWVIADRINDLDFNIRNPNLQVTGFDSKIYSQAEPPFWTLGTFMFILLILGMGVLVGLIWCYSYLNTTLAKQGLNLEDFLAEAQKAKKRIANEDA